MNVRGEAGRVTLLIVGFAAVAVLAVAVVVNASNAFLQRRSLASWADGAVTAAAQSVSHERLYAGDAAGTLPLSETAARDAVAGYLLRHDVAARFDGFALTGVHVDAGSGRVSVELAAHVPLVLMDGAGAAPITADASAVVPLR